MHHIFRFKEDNVINSFLQITTIDEIKKLLQYDDIKTIRGYNKFNIQNKKNSKVRTIYSPNKKLKDIQQTLNIILQDIYRPPKSVHGYVPNKNIKTNALVHLKNNVLFSTDIKNFFPSIHFARIRNLFKSNPFNFDDDIASEITRIVTFNNMLPQGAPTSPIISNMICLKLDIQLLKIAKEYHVSYTRYADDISFSSNRKILIEKVIPLIENVIKQNGFILNVKKTKIALKENSQKVTGLKVNEIVNVDRKFVNQLQSQLYAWNKHGYGNAKNHFLAQYYFKHYAQEEGNPEFINVVYGRLTFLKYIRGEDNSIYIKLAKKFNKLFIKDYEEIKDKKNINKLTYNDPNSLEEKIFPIEFLHESGTDQVDNTVGSAFIIHNFPYLITCNHVVSKIDGATFDYDGKISIINENRVKEEIQLVEVHEHYDIAILELPTFLKDKYKIYNASFEVANIQDIRQSHKIDCFGFPDYNLGDNYSKTSAYITNIRISSLRKYIEVDTTIKAGNSGGPAIFKNKVVGMCTHGDHTMSNNVNRILSIENIIEFINDVKNKLCE